MHSPVFRAATLGDVDSCYAIEVESMKGMKWQQEKNSHAYPTISRRFFMYGISWRSGWFY